VVKLGPRRGDGAFMSIIELVDRPGAAAAEPAEEQATSAEAQESTEK